MEYKNPFQIRHDHLSCPMPLTLESYWACEADCYHCMGRRLNKIWGEEQRIADPLKVNKKLINSQKNSNPKSNLSVALKLKKIIWIGRKSDPYQPIEIKSKITHSYIKILTDLKWDFLICSKYISNAEIDEDLFFKAKKLLTFLVEITPGAEEDWELFERKRTTPIEKRLEIASKWLKNKLQVGIRGEPFIPGYHTLRQFKEILKRIRSFRFKSYNTYNLHINPYTITRLAEIGLDVEKIWYYNQDHLWKSTQQKLCQIADEQKIILGCPDFVNTPKNWVSKTNTCCGVNVNNPFKFNTHNWKILLQNKINPNKIIDKTWEGIGNKEDIEKANNILFNKSKNYYTMKDANL